jgi:hypothetical protein
MAGTSIKAESIRTTSSNSDTVVSLASAGSSTSKGGVTDHASPNQQHVDYILVAEFSIDKGSMMEYQYPNAISGDEQ